MQKTFFDEFAERELTPIARSSDPQTSHKAAAELDSDDCKSVALIAARSLTETHGEATAREIGELAAMIRKGRDVETYRKRIRELARDGLLIECGERRCTITGKTAAVFKGAASSLKARS